MPVKKTTCTFRGPYRMLSNLTESNKMSTYRFDDAYESIYELNGDAYEYLTNYISAGVDSDMTEEEKRDALYQWRMGI